MPAEACVGDPGYRWGLPQVVDPDGRDHLLLRPPPVRDADRAARARSRRAVVDPFKCLLLTALSTAWVSGGLWCRSLRDASWLRFSFLAHFLWLGLGLAAAAISVA